MATTENPPETQVLEGREDVSIGVPRYFTTPGVDPFDTVEWETRDALIPGKDGPSFEQKDVEFPVVLEPDGDQHRRPEVLPRQARLARSASARCGR